MLVNEESFDVSAVGLVCSLDTETTGLNSFKDARFFSIVIADEQRVYYFNFKDYQNEGIIASSQALIASIKILLENPNRVWFMQNAKFDLHMLHKEGLEVSGIIYDLSTLDRLHNNQHMKYNLAEISKRWGSYKEDTAELYMSANKASCVSKKICPETGREVESKHYDRVPFSIIQPYAEQDARATLDVGVKILQSLKNKDLEFPAAVSQQKVIENESKLIKTLYKMEQIGVKIDRKYCETAMNHYRKTIAEKKRDFLQLTGLDFVKGTTVFEEVFASEKDKWVKTDKDNWKWDASVLEKFTNPAAKIALEYAESKKQLEYFENFIYYCDYNDVIHTDYKPSGTVTGRLSSSNPNLQNLSNPDKYEETSEGSLFPVRRAFIPREDFVFVMIDFAQIEYRMFLEYAGAKQLIKEIKQGYDVHQATANISNVSRKEAKTVNFLTLYGGGVAKLVLALFSPMGSQVQISAQYKHMMAWRKTPEEIAAWPTVSEAMQEQNRPLIKKALEIQNAIFRASPEIKDTIKQIQNKVKERGFVFNWLGRRYTVTDQKFAYKIPNHLIQGSSADILKVALNELDDFLSNKQSRMIMNIHDEVVFEIHKTELDIVPKLAEIMRTVYPAKFLPQEVDIEFSTKNLADKEAFSLSKFHGEEARNIAQGEIPAKTSANPSHLGA